MSVTDVEGLHFSTCVYLLLNLEDSIGIAMMMRNMHGSVPVRTTSGR